MNLDFNKEIERIIREKKEISPKALNEIHRIRKKEDEFVTIELRKIGYKISSLYDLVNHKQTNFEYIPTLLKILKSDKVSDDIIKDGIVRALTVKQAKGKVEEFLLNEYQNLNDKQKASLGWTIGNLIEFLYSDKYFDQIMGIVKNKKFGMSRQMFVLALGKTKVNKSESENTLIELTSDNEVVLHAISALGKLKSAKSKIRLTELSNDKNNVIKKEAIKALKKITAE
jgi:HEAT repeat protein